MAKDKKGTKKGNNSAGGGQQLLPAAQKELDQKLTLCQRTAYHAEAYGAAELVMRGMKMQAIRSVVENSEVIENAGYKRLEDFFESIGINPRTGFRLKKMAEAFSDDELTLLQSMGFSQRGVLKLASLPAGLLPDLTTADPEELKSTIEDLIADREKTSKAHTKTVKDLSKQLDEDRQDMGTMKKRIEAFERQYPKDDLHWVKGNRPIHSEFWEACFHELRTFALNDRAVNNTEALEYLREFYDRIVGNLFDLNEEFKSRNAGRSFVRGK